MIDRCEQVPLVLAEVIYPGGKPIANIYFPIEGFISLVTLLDRKPAMEIGMVGREGMLGTPVVLGVGHSPTHAVVQGGGAAWCIGIRSFRREMGRSSALQYEMQLYVYVVMTQMATNSACIGWHRLSARLARWLLMTQDRAQSDDFKVTHVFLAYMLGVRRVGITTAAKILQSQGIIRYQRGHLTVLDRRRLETAACSCYAADRTTYTALLG